VYTIINNTKLGKYMKIKTIFMASLAMVLALPLIPRSQASDDSLSCYEYEGPSSGEKFCIEPERGSYPEPEEGSKGESSGEGSKRLRAADDSLSYYDEYEGPSGEKYCFEPHEGGSCPEPEEGSKGESFVERLFTGTVKIVNKAVAKIGLNEVFAKLDAKFHLSKFIQRKFGISEPETSEPKTSEPKTGLSWVFIPLWDTASLAFREICWGDGTEKKEDSPRWKRFFYDTLPKSLGRGIDKALFLNNGVKPYMNLAAFSISNALAYSMGDIFSFIGDSVGPKLKGTSLGNFFTGVSDRFNGFKNSFKNKLEGTLLGNFFTGVSKGFSDLEDKLNGNFIGRAFLEGTTGFFRTLVSESVGMGIVMASTAILGVPAMTVLGAPITFGAFGYIVLTKSAMAFGTYSLASLFTDGELSLMEKIKNWKENR
jgi:hypothetical protein